MTTVVDDSEFTGTVTPLVATYTIGMGSRAEAMKTSDETGPRDNSSHSLIISITSGDKSLD